MEILELVVLALAVLFAWVAGRVDGYRHGYKDGLENENGWEDEAIWWRKNSVGVCEREKRDHNDA